MVYLDCLAHPETPTMQSAAAVAADPQLDLFSQMILDVLAAPSGGATCARVDPAPAPAVEPSNYRIPGSLRLGHGGAKTKFRSNVEAITLLRALHRACRPATDEEKATLVRYVGWGGLPQAFRRPDGSVTDGWAAEVSELESILSDDELAAARRSTQDAHYTPRAVIETIYAAMARFGVEPASVLEPGCGVGHFVGLAHDTLRASRWTGIELDPLSADIAKALYPKARIVNAGFQEVNLPRGGFDIAIGNPPFGSQSLFDADNRDLRGFSIHAFFFAKSLRALRAGGVLAMVVSHYLLDKRDPSERAWLASRAHFLGAIRLPAGAFRDNASTDVTTDIVFLQKAAPNETPDASAWADVATIDDPEGGEAIPLNRYFIHNPHMMLGRMARVGGMYRADHASCVAPDGFDLAAALHAAVAHLPSSIYDKTANVSESASAAVLIPPGTPVFGHYFGADGALWRRLPDALDELRAELVDAVGRDRDRLIGLMDLRDGIKALMGAERNDANDATLASLRARLNSRYDAFCRRFGLLNSNANVNAFRDDADAFLVRAMEINYQRLDATEAARAGLTMPKGRKTIERADKAAIFTKRVLFPTVASKVESPADALAVCLNQRGRVEIDVMADMLGMDRAAVIEGLGDRVFERPNGSLAVADDYLSGNVKKALTEAMAAATADPRFERNVKALAAVQPADLEPGAIHIAVGSPWVPGAVYAAFGSDVLGLQDAVVTPVPAVQHMVLTCSTKGFERFGTARMTASEIYSKLLSRAPIVVRDKMDDGRYVTNHAETEAARQMGESINEAFVDWVWNDAARRDQLTRIYNDTFNTDRPRTYDGSHLTFPGKSAEITLRVNQVNAVWRMIQDGVMLADQVVGAGKTYLAIAAVMEMRRMGLVSKPLIAVPNHLVQQWACDFMRLYPGANILAVTEADFSKDRRKLMFARIATGDWDAVIVAHSQFTRIAVPTAFAVSYMEQKVLEFERAIAALESANADGRIIKRTEKRIENYRERIKAKLASIERDTDVTDMDSMGIDCLVVDEAHAFKNLGFVTAKRNVSGLGNPEGSQRAEDLFMKVRYLFQKNTARGVFFMTGTPVSNSLAEMFTIQRYLALDVLVEKGIAEFDLWANTFAEETVSFELDSSGRGLKAKTILKRFLNVPEMMAIYHRCADTVTMTDLHAMHRKATGQEWPVPKITGGKPENVICPPSPALLGYIEKCIIPRMNAVCGENGHRPDPSVDNMLKITNDARLAALDVRLRLPNAADAADSKVNTAMRRILAIHQQWAAQRGTQLVFCDLSTPTGAVASERAAYVELVARADHGDDAASAALDAMSQDVILSLSGSFSVYDDLRAKLIEAGVAAHEVAFIHDAKTDLQKQALFDKVNRGDVRILIGSTSKMGAGMNVQRRLVALHHLDAPWRPSDLEQREGRILRQGNAFYEADPRFEVCVIRYATERTYDSRLWQLLERKATVVEQIRKADSDLREVDDVVGQAASAAEMKAAATGEPLIMEQVELEHGIKRLEALKRAHTNRLYDADRSLKWLERDGGPDARLAAAFPRVVAAESYLASAPRDPFEITVAGIRHTTFKDGANALAHTLAKAIGSRGYSHARTQLGTYRKAQLTLVATAFDPEIELSIGGDVGVIGTVSAAPDKEGRISAAGMIARLDHAIAAIAGWGNSKRELCARENGQIADLRALLAQPFKQQADLIAAKDRLNVVMRTLISRSTSRTQAGTADTEDAHEQADPVVIAA